MIAVMMVVSGLRISGGVKNVAFAAGDYAYHDIMVTGFAGCSSGYQKASDADVFVYIDSVTYYTSSALNGFYGKAYQAIKKNETYVDNQKSLGQTYIQRNKQYYLTCKMADNFSYAALYHSEAITTGAYNCVMQVDR